MAAQEQELLNMPSLLSQIHEEVEHDLIGVCDFDRFPEVVTRHIQRLGFAQMSMGVFRPDETIARRPPVEFLFSSYSPEWGERYRERGYMRRDPVIQALTTGQEAVFDWTDESMRTKRKSQAATIMGEASEHGIVTGYSLSRVSRNGSIFGMSFASPHRFTIAPEEASLLSAIGDQMLTRARKIIARRERFGLSEREVRILVWIGEGETDHQIGERLGVTSRMARKLVSGVISKLQATNRTHAVATAVRSKII